MTCVIYTFFNNNILLVGNKFHVLLLLITLRFNFNQTSQNKEYLILKIQLLLCLKIESFQILIIISHTVILCNLDEV